MKSKSILASAIALTLAGGAWTVATAQPEAEGEPAGAPEAQEVIDVDVLEAVTEKQQLRASELIGKEVRNPQDERLGTVDDLIITEGRVDRAVLSVGGFLGIGAHLVAVPYEELRLHPDEDYLVYDTTRAELEALPEFEYDEAGLFEMEREQEENQQ